MPQLKASKKALRVTKRRTAYNKNIKTNLKASISKIRRAARDHKKEEAAQELKALNSKLDRAVKKRLYKKNTASRNKSRLAKLVNGISEQTSATEKNDS